MSELLSAAVCVQSRKGAYALLLGSGVSRAASIKTGWEIIEDLIRLLAGDKGEGTPEDPAEWYRESYGAEPTYSGLVKAVAPSPADRSQFLRRYFEPTDEEREAGEMVPTRAHRAIAKLVRAGFVRVVLTTNFDRLTEQALRDEGVEPQVLSSPDHVEGMTPLQHSDCTVIKLHGDYLDLHTRNTDDELTEYDDNVNALLDRVLTEYGLIACGWSAEWDHALRAAIERSTRHRFSTFWVARGELGERAKEVTDHRQAVVVPASGADEFFEDLEGRVVALESRTAVEPISRDVAFEMAKRFLADDRHRIRLEELVRQETEALAVVLESEFDVGHPTPDNDSIPARGQRAESASASLAAILMAGGYWGAPELAGIWRRPLVRAITFPSRSGTVFDAWKRDRILPATFLLYSAGISCIAAGRHATLLDLFGIEVISEYGESRLLIDEGAARFSADFVGRAHYHPTTHTTPGSDWVHERLADTVGRFLGGEPRYSEMFDRFELMLGMSLWHRLHEEKSDAWGVWIPDGRYRWKERRNVLHTVKAEIEAAGKDWPPLVAGFFDGQVEAALAAHSGVVELISKLPAF